MDERIVGIKPKNLTFTDAAALPLTTITAYIEQHNLLSYAAQEIDAGRIRTTLSEILTPINAENMRVAQAC